MNRQDAVGLVVIGGAIASLILLTRSSSPASSQVVAAASGDPGVDPGGGSVLGKPVPPQTTPYPVPPSSSINAPGSAGSAGPVVAGYTAPSAPSPPQPPPNYVATGTTGIPPASTSSSIGLPPSGIRSVIPTSFVKPVIGPLGTLGNVPQVGLSVNSNLQAQAMAIVRAGAIPTVNIDGTTYAVATPGGPPGGASVPQIQRLYLQSQQLSAGVHAVAAQQRAQTAQLAATLANVPILGPALAASYQAQVAAAAPLVPARPGVNYLGQPYGIATRRTYSAPAPAARVAPAAAPPPRVPVPGRSGPQAF